MDIDTIARCTGATSENAAKYAYWLTFVMEGRQITTVRRQAAFLATLAVESGNLSDTEEDLYYKDAARLAKLYPRAFASAAQATPYTRNPEALGQLLYGGYWGRGLIQLTWKENYKKAGDALGVDLINQPELVAQPEYAVKTAGWFWDDKNCNAPADEGDMRGVTLRVNGKALLHLDRRIEQYTKALEVLT